MENVEVVVCTNRALKIRSSYHFVENSAYFVLKIELLLNVLSNFERERLLMTQLFDGKGFWPIKYYDLYIALIISLSDLAWHMVWYIQYLWWRVAKWSRTKWGNQEKRWWGLRCRGFQSWGIVAWFKRSSLYFEKNFSILLLYGILNTSIFKVRDTLHWVNFIYSNFFSSTFSWGR